MFCLLFQCRVGKKMLHVWRKWITKLENYIQSITKRHLVSLGVVRAVHLFPAAHSNTFPFIPLIFLERQFPPCTRASHILCKMLRDSTLPFTFYLCSQFDYPIFFFSNSRKSDSSLFVQKKIYKAEHKNNIKAEHSHQ